MGIRSERLLTITRGSSGLGIKADLASVLRREKSLNNSETDNGEENLTRSSGSRSTSRLTENKSDGVENIGHQVGTSTLDYGKLAQHCP